MQNDINTITQQLFHKDNLNEVSEEDLGQFISKYPYVAPARFLLAKKKHQPDISQPDAEVITAGLYFRRNTYILEGIARRKRDSNADT